LAQGTFGNDPRSSEQGDVARLQGRRGEKEESEVEEIQVAPSCLLSVPPSPSSSFCPLHIFSLQSDRFVKFFVSAPKGCELSDSVVFIDAAPPVALPDQVVVRAGIQVPLVKAVNPHNAAVVLWLSNSSTRHF
jgi:hypothetical protein